MRTCLRYADNDFAKMRSRGHVPVGCLRLIKGEYLIDYRLNAARRYRTAHRLEHLHRADGDALHVGATGKDQSRIEFGCRTAQPADQSDLATDADYAERAGKRRGTADLDNVVNATAAGKSERSLLPVGRGLVVDAVIGAERLRTRELVIARRRNDHLNAHRARELEAEDRDATGALQQRGLAGDEFCVLHHGVPNRDGSTGEGRALFQRQVRWNFYDPVLLQHRVFPKHAIDAAAKRACVDIGRRLATGPALKEAPGDAVADPHAGDTGTDLDDFPRAIRQRDEVLAHRHPVGPAHNAEIAEIERAGLNFHHDLAIGRLGIGPLDFDQRIDAGAAFRQLIGMHSSLWNFELHPEKKVDGDWL